MRIDEPQFAEIYDQFAPKIFKYCYVRVGSREEAEDIASQVFIRAWDHIAEGKRVTHVQGFLYRIAGNLIIDFYRKNKDKREISLDDPRSLVEIPDASNIPEHLNQEMQLEEIRHKLGLLPETYREIIILKYVNDLSIQEIAAVLQTSENNVSVRLHRAVEKLKILL